MNKKFKKLTGLILITIALLAFNVQAEEWKYAMGEGETDPHGIYATAFKRFIEENSRHTIKIYPIGSLGEETDMLEQTKAGILQFLGQSTGYIGGTIPEMDLFTLPYVMPTDTKQLDYFFKNSKVINPITLVIL